MHSINAPEHHLPFLHKNGEFPIRAAAKWEAGVVLSLAKVFGHDGIEAEGFIEEGAEVFHTFQLFERGNFVV